MKAFLALLLSVVPLLAGQLDVAVIQFSSLRDQGELAAALGRITLAEITDADRTRTKEVALQGGSVLFAQSFPASPGDAFTTSTRLGNTRADVKGRLGSGSLSVQIDLIDGVQAGLRNFQTRTYSGNAPLPSRTASLISIRERRIKSPQLVRGEGKVETATQMIIVAAQYRP
jgi:hypothetical protein